jgi:hypothetical protein
MASRIGAYIWSEISAPKLSEPSKSWMRLADILRSGYRNTISRGIEPEHKTLPWQEDLVFRRADPKSQSN